MKLFAHLYRLFQRRRGWLLLALVLLALLCARQLAQLQLQENVEALLPDGDSQVAADFRRLQQAPFARKLVIHLRAAEGVTTAELLAATDKLRAALPVELFSNPLSGPDTRATALLQQLGSALPLLLEPDELAQLDGRLTPEAVDRSLQGDLVQLLQPQGLVLKEQLQRDPLGLEQLALAKLRYVNPIPGVRLVSGHFVSNDGRSSLILADTPVAITDAAGSARLHNAFVAALKVVPAGVTAQLISGHAYTLANSRVIRADMRRVLLVSALGILLLFALFLRSWRALAVYLLPLLSMAAALWVTALGYRQVSGITVGFGAVLLGITIDFGLHVFFALRNGRDDAAETLRAVSRPILFGGLTTLAAFAVLSQSVLPGQRQLALFAGAGIVVALLLALVVLPHFLGNRTGEPATAGRGYRRHLYLRRPGLRWSVLLLWVVVMALAAVQAQKLRLNGELRQLGYLPPELQQAEAELTKQWGTMRGRALLFAGAPQLDQALQRNEKLWQLLGKQGVRDRAVSLAPLLPSRETQQQRLQAWEDYWQPRRDALRQELQQAGARYGFAPQAFAHAYAVDPETLPEPTPEQLRAWGLGGLLDNLLLRTADGYELITLIPDQPQLLVTLEPELAKLPGVELVSQSRFGRDLSREVSADFSRFISLAGLAVVLLLLLLFRRPVELLLALLPVLSGLVFMFGGMGWLGVEMNMFNVVASILIIGLGVDYGIFMVCSGRQEQELAPARAILVSGLTTLVGFGALVLARHPALHSIGLTVLLGISAAVPTAVLVIPALRLPRS